MTSGGARDLDYPQLFRSTEQKSAEAQSTFYRAKAAELSVLTLGAAFGLIGTSHLYRLGPILAVLMFAAAITLQVSRLGQSAERRWYDARAASESIKSASWQYAVGGEAFRLNNDSSKAKFIDRLREILLGLPHLDVGTPTTVAVGVTEDMEQLREDSQHVRYLRYSGARIDDQVRWYAGKAAWNKARAQAWRFGLMACEFVALVLGLVRVAGRLDIDLLSILAAAAAGLVGWIQAKNYTYLAESYAVTSYEVGLVAQTVHDGVAEDAWAQSVHDAEAAFSREHTMWIARRQGPR